jgi:hypothetical protein
MTDEISQAGNRLRKAVASECFPETEARVAEYARVVTEAARKLPPGDGRALETVRNAVELLIWAERAVRASRGHAMNQLARVTAGRAYRVSAVRREPAYRLQG